MSIRNHWLFTQDQLDHTPSSKCNITQETENEYRREGIKYILETGKKLTLAHNPTLATASVFFHRFYMFHSFEDFPKHVTALSCLFLAGKVEETPKKCKDIVIAAKECNPEVFKEPPSSSPPKTLLEEVMNHEKVLLQTLRFDLHVEHPYGFLYQYAKGFKMDRLTMSQVVQHAWTFVNDSISTTLCLLWEPEIIAISMLYMSFKIAKIEELDWQDRNANEQWWDLYVANLTVPMMEDICHKVIDLIDLLKEE